MPHSSTTQAGDLTASDAPLLSIVTASFNSAKTIADSIQSVRSQTFRDFEHIIVDGGSTDGTLAMLEQAGDSVQWISEPDEGIYDAMNKGIRMARGRWIHLLNSDDYYAAPDVLARIVPHLKDDAVNYCDLIRAYTDGRWVEQRFSFRKWLLYVSAYLPHPSLLVSAQQYKRLGLYDTTFRIAADHDMILRLVDTYAANHIPIAMTVMRQEGISTKSLDLSMQEFERVLRKHEVPPPLVGAVMAMRRLWWKMRSNEQ